MQFLENYIICMMNKSCQTLSPEKRELKEISILQNQQELETIEIIWYQLSGQQNICNSKKTIKNYTSVQKVS